METIGFNEFLLWLMAGGSTMAASWLLEHISAFGALSSELKKFISYALAAGFALGAYALTVFAPDFVLLAEPYFRVLALVFGSIFLGNAFHKFNKSGAKG